MDTKAIENFDRFANSEEVLEVTGVKPGAVCPILLRVPILVDKKVMQLKRINIGSGDHLKGIEMDLKDFLEALKEYKVMNLLQA